MNAVAPADTLDRWRAQPCTDTHIDGIDGLAHARFGLTHHSGHGCALFHAALSRVSVVVG